MRPRQPVWPWEGLYLYSSRKKWGSSKVMVGRNWREVVCVGPRHVVENKGADVAEGIWDKG
jgi:hypothetical protein